MVAAAVVVVKKALPARLPVIVDIDGNGVLLDIGHGVVDKLR
jgi:hypothetical protein